MTEPFVTHNFDAVNHFVEREQRRSIQLLRDARANRWMVWGKVASWFALAVSAIVLAVGLIWWLFQLDTSSERGAGIGIAPGTIDALLENITTADRPSVRADFTIFVTRELDSDSQIVTGFNYVPDDVEKVVNEYCYHAQPMSSDEFLRTNLGHRDPGTEPVWSDSVSAEMRSLGESYCMWGEN